MPHDMLVIKAKGDDGYRNISLRIQENLLHRLDDIAVQTNRSRNDVVCVMLEYGLEHLVVENKGDEKQ